MGVAGSVRTEVGPSVLSGLDERLRGLAALLAERAAPHGFVSLLLTGSLAREEGSMLLGPTGPQLFNDVDMALVTERAVPAAVVSHWRADATALLAPDSHYAADRMSPLGLHADLVVLRRRRLRHLPCTLFNFDLQAARVLAGQDVLSEIPAFRAPDIPGREALLLLGNRCLSLAESAGPPEAETALWMHYHALKAVIDAGAALLILSGRYSTHPRERLAILEEVVRSDYPSLLAHWPELTEMTEAAILDRQVLRADLNWEEAFGRWKEARAFILHALRCALARVLGVAIDSSWQALSEGLCRWWVSLRGLADGRHPAAAAAGWVAVRAVGRPRRLLAQAMVHAAAPHLLIAVEPAGRSPPECHHSLGLAGSYLSRLTGTTVEGGETGDWRAVRDVAVDSWKGIT